MILSLVICFGFSQTRPTIDSVKLKYTWKGKTLTAKQYRDTIDLFLIKYCDSAKKTKKIKVS